MTPEACRPSGPTSKWGGRPRRPRAGWPGNRSGGEPGGARASSSSRGRRSASCSSRRRSRRFLGPADPNALNPRAKAQPPSFAHPLGTDEFGRDLWSRLLRGARITLVVGLSSVAVAATLGTLLGSVAAYGRGPVETGIMRVMDGLLCFPPILLGIFVVTFLGPSLRNLILVIGVLYVPRFTRVVHASTLAVRELEYVESARALGASAARVVATGHPAEHRGANPRAGLARRRSRHPARVGPLVPRPGAPAADPVLGAHGGAVGPLHAALRPAAPLALGGHLAHGARVQPPGRRPARPARPSAAARDLTVADRRRRPTLGRRRRAARAGRPGAGRRDVHRHALGRRFKCRARRQAHPVRRELPGLLLPPDLHGHPERDPPRPCALPVRAVGARGAPERDRVVAPLPARPVSSRATDLRRGSRTDNARARRTPALSPHVLEHGGGAPLRDERLRGLAPAPGAGRPDRPVGARPDAGPGRLRPPGGAGRVDEPQDRRRAGPGPGTAARAEAPTLSSDVVARSSREGSFWAACRPGSSTRCTATPRRARQGR